MRDGERFAMEAGDGARAWMVLRRLGEYRAAWRAHAAASSAPALEPGPFPIRIKIGADREAARFELLAWEDPRGGAGPALPFWRQPHMAEVVLEPGVEPLASQVAAGGGSIEGLRLMNGTLVLKVENKGCMLSACKGGLRCGESGEVSI